jgi:hypothetical protein
MREERRGEERRGEERRGEADGELVSSLLLSLNKSPCPTP